MLIIILIIISCFVSLSFSSQNYKYENCSQLIFIPMPKKISCNINDQTKQQLKQPCDIQYLIYASNQNTSTKHIKQLIRYQMYQTFKCRSVRFGSQPDHPKTGTEMIVQVQIKDVMLKSAFTTKQQGYNLSIARERSMIQANHYVGFVRGLETFLQSITCNKYFKQCYMIALPIHIEDEPLFVYRGILIDTSRHFLPIRLIKETIDAMMYNKLNILHWHIVDEDSFPLILKSHPELAEYAAFSMYETYSTQEVKQIVEYAMMRGVRIIPEVDSPGHAASWARAPQNFDVACTLIKSKYRGPLDVTLDKTYKLMKEIFAQIFELFPDPYIHLGGDQVQLTCLQNKTQFLHLQNITQDEIQLQYRKKQKKILKQLNSSKTFIYWQYDKMVQVEQDDIIHWWGRKAFVPASTKNNKIILSPSLKTGEFYIDMGVGGPFGTPYHMYSTWFDMYKINVGKEITAFSSKDNIIGCVLTLWSQVSNIYTHHSKIWIRSSAMAERMWTAEQHNAKPDFLRRLVAHEKLMNRRGISTSPATPQYCEKSPQFC